MTTARIGHEFSAHEVIEGEDCTLKIHFGAMSCEDFALMMSDVIARAAEHFEFDAYDLLEAVEKHLVESIALGADRIN